jgi:signal transduction histidine kinase
VRRASLRAKILWGAILWTIGLFAAALLVSTALLLRNRSYAITLHGTAEAHGTLLMVLIGVCVVSGLVLVRRALEPLTRLRDELAAVRASRHQRIPGRYPAEVQPLVDELNGLLDHQDRAVRRALAKAGDLAHGLKTPLAVLAHEAERARAAGETGLAGTLDAQVDGMRRQIDYHLAHARAAASGATSGARARVRDAVEGLARTLERLHAGRGITIDVDVDPSHVVRTQREDLDEMLGNLLDNACKWTRTRVAVRSRALADVIEISVEDDGPGVAPSMLEQVLQRGVRADEAAPGSGFGLAIVGDLAELYGGWVAIENLPTGGLRARLTLPEAGAVI